MKKIFLIIVFFIYFFNFNVSATEKCIISTEYYSIKNNKLNIEENCCNIDKGLELLVKDPKYAEKIFLNNIKKTRSYYCKAVSHAYLAYIYSNYDLKKSNVEIKKATNLIIENNKENDNNFQNFKFLYLDEFASEKFPESFNSKDDVIDGITFIIPYFTSDMLVDNKKVLDALDCHFGGARDSWAGPFFVFSKPHLDIVFDLKSVENLLNSKKFEMIKKNRKYGFDMVGGTIRFCMSRSFRASEITMSLLPIEAFKNDIKSDYCIYINDYEELDDGSYKELDTKMCYNDFKKYFVEDLELKKLYDVAVRDIEKYYFEILNLDKTMSSRYAEYAIKHIILDNIYYR